MQSETFRELIRPIEKVRRVIWLAFIATVPLYIFSEYAQLGWPATGASSLRSNPMVVSLVLISLLCALAAPWMPGFLLPDARLREFLGKRPDLEELARGGQVQAVNQERLARIRTLAPDEQRLLALVPRFFTGFIVRLAFNESIALYGLVLASLSRNFVAMIPFAALSLVLNLAVSPKMDSDFERVARIGTQAGPAPIEPH